MSKYIFLKADQTDEADRKLLRAMLEAYFNTENDSEQMPIRQEGHNWIKARIPECAMLIKYNDDLVGSTLILPCTLNLMKYFIDGQLNEAQLVECIREEEINYENMETIYCCSAFIIPSHRGKDLAYQTLLASIQKITPKDKKLSLFYWAYSLPGKNIVEKLAKTLNVEVYSK